MRALETIVGPLEGVRGLSLGWDDDLGAARRSVEEAIAAVDPGGGVLILTDMFGGTPTNVALSFLRDGVEIVTGVNLPMLIKFAGLRGRCGLGEAARRIKEQGQRSIVLASESLAPGAEGAGRDPA
jgi:PTS system mannose-specific IIA component